MADNNESPKPALRRVTSALQPGQPIQTELVEVAEPTTASSLCAAVAQTLKAYGAAARDLLAGQYARDRELAPPHLRVPCHIYVMCCPDGILVRYDATQEPPKVRYTDFKEHLQQAAPAFSEQVIHVPDDPTTYVPNLDGPSIRPLLIQDGKVTELPAIYPIVYAPKTLPPNSELPPPSSRPPCLASLHRELQIQVGGRAVPANTPARALPSPTDEFLACGVMPLPVGWQAIEIYPRLGEEYWRPEYAAAWARHDLSSTIMQRNAIENALLRLDGRAAARERYTKLFDNFDALLNGNEEPCHQFLKANPDILCPTRDAVWSKLRFGDHVSDFVFREPYNDYVLVEIEAPYRELFRQDGHPRQELTHAIGQIDDWLSYIHDNKAKVESVLGLNGISVTPRTLIVIGRSASLTEENRRKLTVMLGQRPQLSIMTYDDLISRSRAQVERHLGPLSIRAQNLDMYFYRGATPPPQSPLSTA
jgi:hypothetical protein